MVITDGWAAARCGGRIGVATMEAVTAIGVPTMVAATATATGVTTIDRLTAITVA
jgi:hypothetical protein